MTQKNFDEETVDESTVQQETIPEPEDTEGHGLLNESFHRPTSTTRNAERPGQGGCRTPNRSHPNRRGER